jgi:hypothetical protein
MEFLHRAVATILKSQQLRDALLYTTLLLIFATVWISDRWPDFTVPALIVTGIFIAGEAYLIYAARRRTEAKPTE